MKEIFEKNIIKDVLKSKRTWLAVLVWVAFVVFMFLGNRDVFLFADKALPDLFFVLLLLSGVAVIFILGCHTYHYHVKINVQNNLLRQREKMLLKINQEARLQSDFLNLVVNSFPHPFYVIDADSYNVVMANKAFYDFHNLRENAELQESRCYELSHHFSHPCNSADHPCPLIEVRKTGKPVVVQHVHPDKMGNPRIVEVNAFPVMDEKNQRVKQVIEYNVDITDRIMEQKKLAENEKRLRSIITTSPDAISVIDLKGNIVFTSDKSAALVGYDHPSQLLGKNVLDFLSPENIEMAKQAIENIASGKIDQDTREFKTLRKDGSFFFQEVNGSVMVDENNQPYAIILIGRDVTQRLKTENDLLALNKMLKEQSAILENLNRSLEQRINEEVEASREKDRMLALQSRQAAMGEMIGNIAHQWRQPLNTINLIIHDLAEAHKHGELDESYFQNSYNEANKVVQRMSQTIDDFRNFYRPDKEKRVFEMNKVVEQSVSFASAGLTASGIRLQLHCNGSVLVEGYSNEMIQVLINILNNAKDSLADSSNEEKVIAIQCYAENSKAIVKIENNGDHIPDDLLEKIFDPYFTTKPEGQGTGLGLFIAKTIVEKNMQGRLIAGNTENGVCFTFEMDAWQAQES